MQNFNFKKSLGQNFLIDKNIINKIVDSIDAKEEDLIIEIGPGSGALTEELIKKNSTLFCYEIDKRLEQYLNKYNNNKTKIIFEDFLETDLSFIDNKYKNVYFIGNLPYYITTPIIMKILDSNIDFKKATFMMQKEVAERITSSINSKNYGSLTVYLNYYFKISKVTNVSKNCFIPAPKVDSTVLSFEPKEKIYVKDEKIFLKLIKDSFKQKRKNLRNNLKNYDLEIIEKTLNSFNKNLTFRAEQITIEEFAKISNNL